MPPDNMNKLKENSINEVIKNKKNYEHILRR